MKWLYAKHVAEELDLTRQQAVKVLRRIPGAELAYKYENRKGERWRVSRDAWDAWRASVSGITKLSKVAT